MTMTLNVHDLANTVRRNFVISQLTSGARILAVILLIGGISYHAGSAYVERQQGAALAAFVQAQAQQSVAEVGLDTEY